MARKKILLVDDSATVLMMEKMLLGKQPYDLVVAKDGSEGLAKAQAERPDLILLDVVMPRMDGFEALRRIRQEEALRATPVIMVTTRGEPVNVEQGYAAGCSDYITKPIDGVELLSKIRTYLGA
ncbi:MAG: response regulator [Deltaproteobacteria bacterium]|nr:response regulator [Deltaproteobacteria bacterium]